MDADLGALCPDFRLKVEELLRACKGLGIIMRPFCTVRDPFEQARLWRQSRTGEEISLKIKHLEKSGAGFLAHCLDSVGPQHGRLATNALPGLSWHQWGEAMDCFWVVDGMAVWSVQKKIGGLNGYYVYADEARKMGLTAGGNWKRFKDRPHVQLSQHASPLRIMDLSEVNSVMEKRFGAIAGLKTSRL
jgi:hypothetical protein